MKETLADMDGITQAYFLGIGGIGMSAIARYFNYRGIKVYGYDKTETALTRELVEEGISIHYSDFGANISGLGLDVDNTLVVLTPAVPANHEEWRWFRDYGFTILKRSEVLGLISSHYKTLAVAGTHGKTTTSSLLAHILRQSHVGCSAFLGGISSNYGTNLLLPAAGITDRSRHCMVVEADEFDRSFLQLHPSISIITSTDADHLDIYGEHSDLLKSFEDFAAQTTQSLFIRKGLDVAGRDYKANVKTYSVDEEADYYAAAIRIEGDRYYFDLHTPGEKFSDLHPGIPGLHNVENAVAASAVALEAGVTSEELREALSSFRGVRRRFEYIVRNPSLVYIDDYAHHPEEIRAIVSSVRAMYPRKRITVVFQPHLYTRTRDFAEGFAQSLSLADELLLLDIYPARELPIDGVSSQMICDRVSAPVKKVVSKRELVEEVVALKPEVLLTLGAGDIDQFADILRSTFDEQ
jgi:UDP-N-acetylmuramate--alanine ligase